MRVCAHTRAVNIKIIYIYRIIWNVLLRCDAFHTNEGCSAYRIYANNWYPPFCKVVLLSCVCVLLFCFVFGLNWITLLRSLLQHCVHLPLYPGLVLRFVAAGCPVGAQGVQVGHLVNIPLILMRQDFQRDFIFTTYGRGNVSIPAKHDTVPNTHRKHARAKL